MAKSPRNGNGQNPQLYAFSRKAKSYLRKAQWTPKRMVNTAPYELSFSNEGLELQAVSKKFLGQFGGLIIRYETVDNHTDVLELCADDAVRGIGTAGLHQSKRYWVFVLFVRLDIISMELVCCFKIMRGRCLDFQMTL